MARTATVGPEIYARVTELVQGGKSPTEAFAEVAKERKSRPGLAANYYRVARQKGQGRKRPVIGRGRIQLNGVDAAAAPRPT